MHKRPDNEGLNNQLLCTKRFFGKSGVDLFVPLIYVLLVPAKPQKSPDLLSKNHLGFMVVCMHVHV